MNARRFSAKSLVGLTVCLTVPGWTHAEVAGTLVIAGKGPEQTTIETLARAFEKANPLVDAFAQVAPSAPGHMISVKSMFPKQSK